MAAGYKKLLEGRDTIIEYLVREQITNSELPDKLFGAGFLTRTVYDLAKNFAPGVEERDRVTVLFGAVLASVHMNPSKYNKLLEILRTFAELGDTVVFIEGVGGSTASDVIQPLTMDAHHDITMYLFGTHPKILQQLGIVLGINPTRLQNISSKNDLVSLWLQRVDQVDANGGPTWATLEEALRYVTIGMDDIADDIRRERLVKFANVL